MNKVGEMALQSVTLTLKLSLKMPFLQTGAESFSFVTFKTDVSIEWKLMYSRISF